MQKSRSSFFQYIEQKQKQKNISVGRVSSNDILKVVDMLVWLAYLIFRGGFIWLRAKPSHFIGVVASWAEERRTSAEI